jgi:hypothetical protein
MKARRDGTVRRDQAVWPVGQTGCPHGPAPRTGQRPCRAARAERPNGPPERPNGRHDQANRAGKHASARHRPGIPDDCRPENLGISEVMVTTSTLPGPGDDKGGAARASPAKPNTDEPEYKSQLIRDVLAQDDRVGELGLEVRISREDGHDRVSVSGVVTTEQRRAAIDSVVRELMPGAALDNQATVVSTGPPDVERVL